MINKLLRRAPFVTESVWKKKPSTDPMPIAPAVSSPFDLLSCYTLECILHLLIYKCYVYCWKISWVYLRERIGIYSWAASTKLAEIFMWNSSERNTARGRGINLFLQVFCFDPPRYWYYLYLLQDNCQYMTAGNYFALMDSRCSSTGSLELQGRFNRMEQIVCRRQQYEIIYYALQRLLACSQYSNFCMFISLFRETLNFSRRCALDADIMFHQTSKSTGKIWQTPANDLLETSKCSI